MMVTNISSGRLLMKSMFAGGSCGSGSTSPCFLDDSSLLRLKLALVFPKEERMMQHSSVSISLSF